MTDFIRIFRVSESQYPTKHRLHDVDGTGVSLLGYSHKVPHTEGLKQQKRIAVRVLEAGNCEGDIAPSPTPNFCWVVGNLWCTELIAPSPSSLPSRSNGILLVCMPFQISSVDKDTDHSFGLGYHPTPV